MQHLILILFFLGDIFALNILLINIFKLPYVDFLKAFNNGLNQSKFESENPESESEKF